MAGCLECIRWVADLDGSIELQSTLETVHSIRLTVGNLTLRDLSSHVQEDTRKQLCRQLPG